MKVRIHYCSPELTDEHWPWALADLGSLKTASYRCLLVRPQGVAYHLAAGTTGITGGMAMSLADDGGKADDEKQKTVEDRSVSGTHSA